MGRTNKAQANGLGRRSRRASRLALKGRNRATRETDESVCWCEPYHAPSGLFERPGSQTQADGLGFVRSPLWDSRSFNVAPLFGRRAEILRYAPYRPVQGCAQDDSEGLGMTQFQSPESKTARPKSDAAT